MLYWRRHLGLVLALHSQQRFGPLTVLRHSAVLVLDTTSPRLGNLMQNAPVPLLDLRAQFATIRSEVGQAIERVVESQHFINGPDVAAFEDELARYGKVDHAIGVSSGSDALLVALMALGIGPGDEVITTPYTFFATVGAIVRLGAIPVFVDIDPISFNIEPAGIEAAVTPRTRAILPVHLFGQCAEMGPILAIASKHGLAVVEDAAQAIGAAYQGQPAGSLGTVGCLSFFPSKNLGAFGDAGAVVTNDRALADKIRLLRNHGASPKYFNRLVGGNFRIDTLHAAVLRVKLRHLESWTVARQRHAAHYTSAFTWAGLEGDAVQSPRVVQSRHIFNQFVVRLRDRDNVRHYLKQQQIETEVYYPRPMHLQECFAALGHRGGTFPESELAATTTLALPVYPELTMDQQDRVVQTMVAFYQGMGRQPLSRVA